jgi:serine/threonine protein kinase
MCFFVLLTYCSTVNEGTYGTVYEAKDPETGTVLAVKFLKRTESRTGFPYYMLREILWLRYVYMGVGVYCVCVYCVVCLCRCHICMSVILSHRCV